MNDKNILFKFIESIRANIDNARTLKISKKVHAILTYKMGDNRKGCINQDNNAV